MAGKINGFAPFDFQKSTTERTIVAILVMPRLPTPIATRAPGLARPLKGEFTSSLKTAGRTSRMPRSGKCWRTSRRRGSSMPELYQARFGRTAIVGGWLFHMFGHVGVNGLNLHSFLVATAG